MSDGLSCGRLEVDGLGTFKDAKLWPGGGRARNWKETGTEHRPGIQVSDVAELVEHGAEVVILSRERTGVLGVKDETLEWLEARGVDVHVLRTPKATGATPGVTAAPENAGIIAGGTP